MLPSDTATSIVSTLYNIIVPDACPAVNAVTVPVPKFVPMNVGLFPNGDDVAPENVNVLLLIYPVATLRYGSYAVMVIVCPLPAVCVPVPVILSAAAVAGETTTDRFVVELYVPSVTATVAVSTLYNARVPVAVPLLNVIDVPVPKFTVLTVGLVESGEAVAPLNVIVLAPV